MTYRRSIVFLVFAVACLLQVFVLESDLKWVAVTVGVTYVVLALASALDALSRRRQE